jgi:hypothetical protein
VAVTRDRINYAARLTSISASEAAILASVYSLALRAHEDRKMAVPADGRDDAKEIKNDRATKPSIP